jgi:hypothetical protein
VIVLPLFCKGNIPMCSGFLEEVVLLVLGKVFDMVDEACLGSGRSSLLMLLLQIWREGSIFMSFANVSKSYVVLVKPMMLMIAGEALEL